ncbi:MAG: class I SAM-dependent methyltransferase [Methanobacteriota archaeon]
MMPNQKGDDKQKKRFLDSVIRSLEKFLSRHPWWARRYAGFFEKMTVDEFSIVSLPAESRVLTIGCGSFPHTMFTLARVRGWKLVGIDHDRDAVKKAQQMIAAHHLGDKIEVCFGEALEADISDFDLVFVAHGVEPKLGILTELERRMKPGTMIVYRTIWDGLERVYGHEPIPETLRVKDAFFRSDGIKTLLLVRNENPK